MWSGPRNISTALMRSWGNRADTFVCDEPLYAHYLTQVEIEHPGADEIVAHHETDWRKVVEWLTGPVPEGKPIFYQKQMAHHLLPEIDRGWLEQVTNVFLIREPLEMLTSLARVLDEPGVADTGLPQQVEIFDQLVAAGETPPVIDSRDVLENPAAMLAAVCTAVGVPFDPAMLHWPAGPRETDGIWARHWYAAVEKSTGFQTYRPKNVPLPPALEGVHRECVRYYDLLHRHRLTV